MEYNIYKEWNFKENPFQTSALPPLEIGSHLIAGRDSEIKLFLRRLYNQPQVVTLEGANGIGKTSIINVAVFRTFLDYLHKKKATPSQAGSLFIPCIKIFQLSRGNLNFEEFQDEVFIEIAQTIIDYKRDILQVGLTLPSEIEKVETWLNSPTYGGFQANFGISLASVGYGSNSESNPFFEKSGFHKLVKDWLKTLFPNNNSGGIVCVIDNLELLEKSEEAKKCLEIIRDSLFNIHAIRWVLCGSSGIVKSLASSQRLEGFLHEPIEVQSISKEFIHQVYFKRIDKYKVNTTYYMPLTVDSFTRLYGVLNCNIRNTLKFANDFCLWVADTFESKPILVEKRDEVFNEWLNQTGKDLFSKVKRRISKESIDVLTKMVSTGSEFTLLEFESLLIISTDSSRILNELIRTDLIIYRISDLDDETNLIKVTPKGHLIHYINSVD